MRDYLALAVVLGVVFGVPWLLARLGAWRRCRCGRLYCTGCGRVK